MGAGVPVKRLLLVMGLIGLHLWFMLRDLICVALILVACYLGYATDTLVLALLASAILSLSLYEHRFMAWRPTTFRTLFRAIWR